jgi:hypothetical protein
METRSGASKDSARQTAVGLAVGPNPPRVQTGEGVAGYVREHGGRLYVWKVVHRCCTGGLALLESAVEPPARPLSRFTRLEADGFELWLDAGSRLPETLVLELSRGKRKVRAFWDGCAFML